MNVMDSFRLDGKVAVLTGSAGLFGRQIADALVEAGARLFIASRNIDSLEEQATRMRQDGHDVTAHTLDQGSEESIRMLLDFVLEQAGRVDILINNSVLRPMSDWSSPAEDFARSMEVNATGIFMMTRAFGEQMAKQNGGSIINIASIYGMIGPDFTLYEGLGWGTPPDYYFHKGGMIQLTKFAASKLGPHGVRVNCISPGGFYNNQEQIFVDRYEKRTFLGRMANEEDLKGAIVFLASDASAYVTGVNIPVDGGLTAK
ncbi:MAG TPA: SDR family oxidoreductase [bacterium]|mgnify:CR=1 FL=1|nr:SDR family oxidoreductase [bacterium]